MINLQVGIWHTMIANGWKASAIDFSYDVPYSITKLDENTIRIVDRSPRVMRELAQIIRRCYEKAGEPIPRFVNSKGNDIAYR